ncbi:transglycosylase SLT domain-containing protein [Bacteriovorax sp. PP10]|uniref:Transglycosylase SLT domain-containing protein n=1 Tax=Bacteriovorax antarcticus TaxID=3088717 RepID=A0ABU5VSK5_9BACT|nr:transglycosylase SLT domain-containing protein [Bacteriovorax sp. PP10]MEA9356032.1 transglycosylase SLT domain-containing protein [Bacteriovorax sp. PP10]
MRKITVVFLALVLASCTTIKKNTIHRTNTVSLAATDFQIAPPLTPLKEEVAEIEVVSDDDDDIEEDMGLEDEHKTLLAETPTVESLIPNFVIDGVAFPEHKIGKGKIFYLEGAEELNLENNFFDIPVVYNPLVKKWVEYFTTRGRKFFSLYVERAGRYAPMIGSILEENDLPRDLIFLAMAESGFSNHAKSVAAAVGPWQFMPATGKNYSLNQNWYVDERKDPIKATIAAAQYLGKLYNDFGAWEIATAAYNAGEGKLGRAIKKYKTNDFWELSKGKYLKSETKNYVPKIMALAIIGKNLKTFGFTEIDFRAPLIYKEVQVGPMTDILKLSKALNLNPEEVQKLNPEILRWFTPPDVRSYTLRLPPMSAESYANCCLKKDFKSTNFQEYIVPKKMSLLQVSKKFRLKNTLILSHLNSLSPKAKLSKGVVIKLPFRKEDKLVSTNRYYADLFDKTIVKKKKVFARFYKVKKGDSLFHIAKKHKTTVSRIMASNSDIPRSGKVYPGLRLVIK